MEFDFYQKEAVKNKVYGYGQAVVYPALGLAGETGEVVDKIKKVLRDNSGEFSFERRLEIARELGDVLWYCAALAEDMELSLDIIAEMNLDKIRSRRARNKVHGEGDNR